MVVKSSERFKVLDSMPGSIINQLDVFHQGSGYFEHCIRQREMFIV